MPYHFGAYSFDPARYDLRHAGTPVPLRPQACELLAYLLRHRDRVVPKEELLAQVWPGQYVGDGVLHTCVLAVRTALHDTGRMPALLHTVRGRGYRFVAPVEVRDHPPAAPPMPTAPDHLDHAAGVSLPPLVQPEPLTALLPGLATARGASAGGPGLPDAERRQLTVLCCDVVGSTPLVGPLDPEDWRAVVQTYHAACAAVIQRFEGTIAQYLGDGLLVYFGYPHAHEDDAQRAVRAGFALVEAVSALTPSLHPPQARSLAIRVGMHTGLVVVGAIGGGDRHAPLALGDTPHIAARIQDLAPPDTVLLSDATHRLVQGWFTCADLGTQALKGMTTPIHVYRVLGASGARSRLEVAGPAGLTPFVGREAEVTLLRDRWGQVQDGLGQVVLLSGEAGIGKSRLVQVLQDHLAGEPHTRLECRGTPYHTNSALYPLIDLWQRMLPCETAEAPADTLHRLEQMLEQYGLPLAETVPLFAALLALPADRYPALALPPQQQKRKTLEALLALLVARATQEPLLLIVEDLHWVDPSTLEFLSLLVDQGPTARMLTLCTFRPPFPPPWAPRAHIAQLTLTRLPRPQVERMVTAVAGGMALPAEVVQQLVTRSDGVPLFVEEMTKLVLASGLLREHEEHYTLTGPLPPLAIPTTLQDALMARLDQLGAAKAVAQLGATLGREFPYAQLRAVATVDDLALWRALGQLVQAEVLYQRGALPQATYLFKHALIQEAAYHSLLRSTRQQYHQRIVQVFAERFPDTVATQPELLAHHATAAGLTEEAVAYWQRAGERALERSAYVEAIAHLRQGLALLPTLPDTLEHRQQELDMQVTLGGALMATQGFAAPDVEAVYHRARALCQQVGETPQLLVVLTRLGTFYNNRLQFQEARELGEQALRLAQRVHDPAGLAEAHIVLGNTSYFLGELDAARTHLEQSVALDTQQQTRSQGLREVHREVFCLSRLAHILWYLGYPDQALRRSHEALTLARELSHPFSLAGALGSAALLHQLRREGHRTYELAEAAIALSSERGFALRLAEKTMLRGWALVEQGQGEAGIAQIRRGLTAHQTTRSETTRAYIGMLAEASGKVGEPEEGLRLVDEALANRRAESQREVEFYRLKGTLLLMLSYEHHAEAETCFRQAVEMARRQQARSLELRAATSLARLWQRQGRCQDAYDLLAPIYGWFTEGFDTADLQEAKVLLDELGR